METHTNTQVHSDIRTQTFSAPSKHPFQTIENKIYCERARFDLLWVNPPISDTHTHTCTRTHKHDTFKSNHIQANWFSRLDMFAEQTKRGRHKPISALAILVWSSGSLCCLRHQHWNGACWAFKAGMCLCVCERKKSRLTRSMRERETVLNERLQT